MFVAVNAERIDLSTGSRVTVQEAVAAEVSVSIYVNDRHVISLLATPGLERELALGWLLDEGVIHSMDDLEEVRVDQNDVTVMTKERLQEETARVAKPTRTITSAGEPSFNQSVKDLCEIETGFVRSAYQVGASEIVRMVQELNNRSQVFRLTGGTHSAALFEDGKLVAFAEDVGRHNAVDKVVGIGVQSKVDFARCLLVSSGRQPANMVLKAARMGIPIVASKASPISSGIAAAEKAGLTLVCFVRERRMNVYTHPRRVCV